MICLDFFTIQILRNFWLLKLNGILWGEEERAVDKASGAATSSAALHRSSTAACLGAHGERQLDGRHAGGGNRACVWEQPRWPSAERLRSGMMGMCWRSGSSVDLEQQGRPVILEQRGWPEVKTPTIWSLLGHALDRRNAGNGRYHSHLCALPCGCFLFARTARSLRHNCMAAWGLKFTAGQRSHARC